MFTSKVLKCPFFIFVAILQTFDADPVEVDPDPDLTSMANPDPAVNIYSFYFSLRIETKMVKLS